MSIDFGRGKALSIPSCPNVLGISSLPVTRRAADAEAGEVEPVGSLVTLAKLSFGTRPG